jgi:transcriptional regulator with XRE-family HTH domain
MDSALLSKIEHGQRLPTAEQTAAFAKFFGANVTAWEARRMAEKFLSENGHNPAAAVLAVTHMQENAAAHFVNRKRVAVNYRAKSVRKSKKEG